MPCPKCGAPYSEDCLVVLFPDNGVPRIDLNYDCATTISVLPEYLNQTTPVMTYAWKCKYCGEMTPI